MYSEELIQKAKECLADTFVMYMKAHAYHWNVVGSNFPQYHEFLGSLYEELHNAVDPLAEQIRTLDSFAPFSLSRMIELSSIVPHSIAEYFIKNQMTKHFEAMAENATQRMNQKQLACR